MQFQQIMKPRTYDETNHAIVTEEQEGKMLNGKKTSQQCLDNVLKTETTSLATLNLLDANMLGNTSQRLCYSPVRSSARRGRKGSSYYTPFLSVNWKLV